MVVVKSPKYKKKKMVGKNVFKYSNFSTRAMAVTFAMWALQVKARNFPNLPPTLHLCLQMHACNIIKVFLEIGNCSVQGFWPLKEQQGPSGASKQRWLLSVGNTRTSIVKETNNAANDANSALAMMMMMMVTKIMLKMMMMCLERWYVWYGTHNIMRWRQYHLQK